MLDLEIMNWTLLLVVTQQPLCKLYKTTGSKTWKTLKKGGNLSVMLKVMKNE